MKFLDGNKNYILSAILILLGIVKLIRPELDLNIFGLSEGKDFIAAGIMWFLGRNALKKVERK